MEDIASASPKDLPFSHRLTAEEIEQKVAEALVSTCSVPREKIKSKSRLDDLGLDSFAAIELASTLEETFNIQIADSELAAIKTVNDIVTCVARLHDTILQGQSPPRGIVP